MHMPFIGGAPRKEAAMQPSQSLQPPGQQQQQQQHMMSTSRYDGPPPPRSYSRMVRDTNPSTAAMYSGIMGNPVHPPPLPPMPRHIHQPPQQEREPWELNEMEISIAPDAQVLGSGSFGKVFLGFWQGHQVAIKVPASHSCTKQQVQAFLQEIKIWYPLRHPNILQLYGACNSSNHDYPLIVMEAMECNLSQRLRSGPPLNLMDVLTYCYEIATGISFLHTRAKPVLHGDIKSSNVLLDRMGQVKIADFGFSRVISDANGGSVNASVAGIGGGTYYFMAPERLSGGALTAQVDVYAFGMTCFEIINKGRAPFPSDIQQVTQLFGHVVIEKRRPILPRDAGEACTPELWNLIENCWVHEPHQRPDMPHAASYLASLRAAIAGTPQIRPGQQKKPRYQTFKGRGGGGGGHSPLPSFPQPPVPPSGSYMDTFAPSPAVPIPQQQAPPVGDQRNMTPTVIVNNSPSTPMANNGLDMLKESNREAAKFWSENFGPNALEVDLGKFFDALDRELLGSHDVVLDRQKVREEMGETSGEGGEQMTLVLFRVLVSNKQLIEAFEDMLTEPTRPPHMILIAELEETNPEAAAFWINTFPTMDDPGQRSLSNSTAVVTQDMAALGIALHNEVKKRSDLMVPGAVIERRRVRALVETVAISKSSYETNRRFAMLEAFIDLCKNTNDMQSLVVAIISQIEPALLKSYTAEREVVDAAPVVEQATAVETPVAPAPVGTTAATNQSEIVSTSVANSTNSSSVESPISFGNSTSSGGKGQRLSIDMQFGDEISASYANIFRTAELRDEGNRTETLHRLAGRLIEISENVVGQSTILPANFAEEMQRIRQEYEERAAVGGSSAASSSEGTPSTSAPSSPQQKFTPPPRVNVAPPRSFVPPGVQPISSLPPHLQESPKKPLSPGGYSPITPRTDGPGSPVTPGSPPSPPGAGLPSRTASLRKTNKVDPSINTDKPWHIVNEMRELEAGYQSKISAFLQHLKPELLTWVASGASTGVIDPASVDVLFFGFPDMVALSKSLMDGFDIAITKMAVGANKENPKRIYQSESLVDGLRQIIETFSEHAAKFEIYISYMGSHQRRVQLKDRLIRSDSFNKLLNSRRSQLQRMSVDGLVHLPIQHVTRYSLTFGSILTCIPEDHTIRAEMDGIRKVVGAFAGTMDEIQRQVSLFQRMFMMQAHISKLPQILRPYNRFLIAEVPVQTYQDTTRTGMIVVFSDVVLLLQQKLTATPVEKAPADKAGSEGDHERDEDDEKVFDALEYRAMLEMEQTILRDCADYVGSEEKDDYMILEFDRPSLVTTTLNNPPELGRRLTATSSNSSTGQSVFRVTLTKQAGSDLCRAYLHARHQLNQWRTPVEISSQFMEKQAYVVKREFKARLMQEVTLKTGDSCNILTRYGDTGWAQGQNHNSKRKGVFPLCVFTDRPTTRSSAFFLPNIQSSTPVMRPGIYRFFRTEKAPSQPQSKSSKSKAPPQHPLHLIIRAEEEPVRIIKHQLENHLYVFGRSLRSNEEGWISVVGGNMKGLLQVVEPVPGTVVRPEAGFSRSPGARPVLLRVGDWIDVEMVRGFDKVIGRVRRAAVVQAAITGQPIGSPAEGNEEVWVQIPLDVLEPIVLRDEDLL